MSSPDIAYEGPRVRIPRPSFRDMKRAFAERLAKFALRLYRSADNSNLVSHAKSELQRAGMFDRDADYGGLLGDDILDMMAVFSMAGHSGGSAHMASDIFDKISRYEPLTPLTGADDEWMEVSDGVFQNVRCSHVFKTPERGAYDIDGKVFREPNGTMYTGAGSATPVIFPYTPSTEIVDVPAQPEDEAHV